MITKLIAYDLTTNSACTHLHKDTCKNPLKSTCCVCVVSLLKINFTSILELNILLQVMEFLTQFVPNTIIQNLCNTPERSPHDARGICIRINAKKMSSTFFNRYRNTKHYVQDLLWSEAESFTCSWTVCSYLHKVAQHAGVCSSSHNHKD